jgi:hypothetical protein
MDLMGWRGASITGASGIGIYFGFGGVLMILGAIGEVWLFHPTLNIDAF